MIINFIGNFGIGYVGEQADEIHIARELERLGHTVNKVPRDQWKAYCDGEEVQPDWNLPIKADINLIAKWPHFDKAEYINQLKIMAGESPVFYWVWDFMWDHGFPDWHMEMAKAADLYLSGELGIFDQYKKSGVRPYYFQMDVCDGDIPIFDNLEKIYDVVFTGSCIDQGHRKEWLQEINKVIPVTIFSWNPEEWFKLGFQECYPAVYGEEYNKVIAQSKIVLGFSVEPNCWGYWSNRVGKVLRAGGLLLQEYAPGMETQLAGYNIDFFSTPQEAIEKIRKYLNNELNLNNSENTDRWTSRFKAQELIMLMDRYLKNGEKWLL